MFAFLLSSVIIAGLCHHGFSQESTAQSICDSMGIVGLYSNPDDTTCKQYAKCFTSNSALVGAFYNCSGSTLFNPSLQLCTNTYTCPETTTTTTIAPTTVTTTQTTTESTTAATTSSPVSAQSICDSEGVVGLYPNPDDKTCQQFANCFENSGSLTGLYYNCTGTTLFDPSLQLCTNDYECSA